MPTQEQFEEMIKAKQRGMLEAADDLDKKLEKLRATECRLIDDISVLSDIRKQTIEECIDVICERYDDTNEAGLIAKLRSLAQEGEKQ